MEKLRTSVFQAEGRVSVKARRGEWGWWVGEQVGGP